MTAPLSSLPPRARRESRIPVYPCVVAVSMIALAAACGGTVEEAELLEADASQGGNGGSGGAQDAAAEAQDAAAEAQSAGGAGGVKPADSGIDVETGGYAGDWDSGGGYSGGGSPGGYSGYAGSGWYGNQLHPGAFDEILRELIGEVRRGPE